MGQEKFSANKQNEKDLKNNRNPLIMLVIGVSVSGIALVCLSMIKMDLSKPTISNSPEVITVKNVNKQKSEIKKELKVADLSANKDQINSQSAPKSVKKRKANNKQIKPTDKSFIAKLALKVAGKKDPFKSDIKLMPKHLANTSTRPATSLLPPPPSIDGLPIIGGDLPGIQQAPKPKEYLAIKGFIGNKVIISVNGIDESLGENEIFQGVKVLKVDPVNFKAELEKDGKKITKVVKKLTDVKDDEFELVKY